MLRLTQFARVLFPFVLLGFAAACNVVQPQQTNQPTVVITSPPSGSTYQVGEDVAVQSASADPGGIARVELIVDGAVVRTDTSPTGQPQPQFSVVQPWTAAGPGTHLVVVRATNTTGGTGQAGVNINVTAAVAVADTSTPAPIPTQVPTGTSTSTATSTSIPTDTSTPTAASLPTNTATNTPTAAPCVPNSAFVADMTIPDGTTVAAGNSFVKTWRVKNTGSCDWDAAYTIGLVGGEAMAAGSPSVIPQTPAGGVSDISLQMIAPVAPGPHQGIWRLRSSAGVYFGTNLTVVINVPGAPPAPSNTPSSPTNTPPPGCPGAPNIPDFHASPTTINAGQSSTLSWGFVTNANSVSIDQGIGGVATPGNKSVSPNATTTYKMTAMGCGGTATAQVTVTVNPTGPPEVDQISGHVNINSGNSNSVTLTCPGGSLLTGGGFLSSSFAVNVYRNMPSTGNINQWLVSGRNTGGGTATLNAYAYCAKNVSGSMTLSSDQITVPAGTSHGTTANCAGSSIITGGGFIANPQAIVYNSSWASPTAGWDAYATNNSGSGQSLTAYALCYNGSAEGYQYFSQTNVGANNDGDATAPCNAGQLVTDGGWAASSGLAIFQSTKSGSGWQVFGHNKTGAALLMNSYSVCVSF